MGHTTSIFHRSNVSLLSLYRTQLCEAIVTVADIQDRSSALLKTLLNSLATSFSSYEITSTVGQSVCSAALLKTMSLSRRGYIEGSQEVAQLLANLISAYTVVNNVSLVDAQQKFTRYPVNSAVRTHWVILQTLHHVTTCHPCCALRQLTVYHTCNRSPA